MSEPVALGANMAELFMLVGVVETVKGVQVTSAPMPNVDAWKDPGLDIKFSEALELKVLMPNGR
jgi:hypothetical protein